MQKSTINGASFSRKSIVKFFLIMKLTFALTLLCFLTVSATVHSQNVRMSVSLKDVAMSKLIKTIEKSTPYKFVYNSYLFSADKKISINVADQTVAEILNNALQNTGFTYKLLTGNLIVLTKINNDAQSVLITGFITDEGDQPLPGVTIQIKGDKKTSSATDMNGHFNITAATANDVLIVSCIGFTTQEVPLNGQNSVRIKLVVAANSLNEVQIIGYGTTTRRLSTGAVSSITADDLSKETVTNPLTALQGHIAGMQITQDNGLPGSGVRVSIRGAGSNLSSAGFIPLYVIDGVPFTLFSGGAPASDALNNFGISGASGSISPFSIINPDDIERIDVLKDADATAIYGSRGSNGVVLITTKKGSKGKTLFNVNVNHGMEDVAHFIPMMNTDQYLAMRRAAFAYSGVTPTASNALDLTVWDQNAYTDWQKYFIGGTGNITNATASVTGGDAQNTFLFSTTYRNEGTVFPGSYNATTFSPRLNVGHKTLDGRFEINLSVNYAYMNNNLPSVDVSTLYNLAPNYPIYNNDGSQNWTSTNPLSYFLKQYQAQTSNFISNVDLKYKVLPYLTLKANLGYSLTSLFQTITNPASSQNPVSANTATTSTLSYADNKNDNYIIEPQIQYHRAVGKGVLDALVGTTFQQSKATGISEVGTGYINEALINSLVAASTTSVIYNNYSLYKYNAVFGRVNYNWEDKYILDATFRRDGSSRFGPGYRFGNFGAIGASWIFSKEAIFKNLNFFSFGKLRGSYGITGNDQIPNYLYFSTYSVASSSYAYQGNSILAVGNVQNANLHWEKTKKLDVALELGFIKDRILLKTDFYRNLTSDVLTFISLPAESTSSGYTGNLPAVIQNQGFEFELNTINLISDKFKWSTSVNVTLNRQKLLSYPNLASSSFATTYYIGQPTNITQLYHYTGVDPKTGLPTFQSATGTPTTSDRIIAPYGEPFYGGISNSVAYKVFSLDFTFQFNHRYGYINSTLSGSNPYGFNYTNQSTAVLNRWMDVGDNAYYPAASTASNAAYSNLANSDYNWGDASFIKFKTLSLNYSLPKSIVQSFKLSNLTVYLQGQNLYTWAKQKYTYDPETSVAGAGSALGSGQIIAFPQLRTIILGLNCSF